MKIKYETPEMEIFKFDLAVLADTVKASQGDTPECLTDKGEDVDCPADGCAFDDPFA